MTNTTAREYAFRTHLDVPCEEAIERTKQALSAEGFGVLSEIDVRKTLKEKLDVDFRPYVILGACNPPLAHRALTATTDVGLLLPCNVIVRADGEGSAVEALDPEAGLEVIAKPELREVAREAKVKLQRVIASLQPR